MDLKAGDAVINPRCPDWGQGVLTGIKEGSKAVVFFLNAGQKIMQIDILEPSPEPLHPRLKRLDIEVDETTPYYSFGSALKRFLELFPQGFEDPKYHRHERDWKIKAHQILVNNLNQKAFKKLLDSGKHDQIIEHVMASEDELYMMLSQFEKMALHDAMKDRDARKQFAIGLYDYFYADDDMKERFDRFLKMLIELPQPKTKLGKWPVQTLFLSLRYPDKYVFLKPEYTRKAAGRLRFDIQYRSEPNWSTYRNVLELAELLKQELIKSGHPPEDMIDVQSFIFSIEGYDSVPE